MISKIVDNVIYFCPRPNYKLSPLDASLSKNGLSLASKVLLGNSPAAVFTDDDGHIWMSDFPTPDLLIERIKADPLWIASIFKQRNKNFDHIKESVKIATEELRSDVNTMHSLLKTLQLLSDIQTTFLSYVYLPLVDEILVNKLTDLVSKYLDIREVQQYIFLLLQPPTYFRNILDSGIIINETKVLNIPPTEELYNFVGKVNLDYLPVDFDAIILSRFPKHASDCGLEDAIEFSVLRSLAPIFFQIGQEDLFIGKSIIIALSHCICKIAHIFENNNIISDIKQILNFNIEDIIINAQKLENM